MKRIEKVFCGRMDHGGCGLIVHLEGGKVVKVKGDPDSFTRGYICSKGRAQPERLYHPDRLKSPLKRAGKKGENRWQKISWEEALETICEKLTESKKRSGPESALFVQGTPKGLENLLLYRFAHSFGSPNVTATGTVCFAPRLGASIITNGFYPHPDLEHPPELLVGWGSNHLATSADGVLAPEVELALKKGSRLILIDPVKRNLASRAELWLRIKPGADGLLTLGMIKVILDEGLYDREFVEKWTTGFDALKEHIKPYSLNDIERETWISRDKIKKVAQLYAKAESASILWGNATDHNINSVQTARAFLILMALSGNLDSPGGNIQAPIPEVVSPGEFILRRKYKGLQDKMIGNNFKLSAMLGFVPYHLGLKAVLQEEPYKIDFMYIQGANPLMNCSNAKDTFEALNKVDFLAVAELFMTPAAQLADIVLPVATHFEFNDLGFYGLPFGKIIVRPKIVEPPGECWPDVKIINELAKRLDLEDFFWKDEEECINYILKPSGFSFQDLKKNGILQGENKYWKHRKKGFRTKSGKVEIYSSWMEKNGYPPLPVFSKLTSSSEKGMDLIFTSAKIPVFFHSMNRNLPSLRKSHPDPLISIHPETAKSLNIEEGEWVWVESGQGKVKLKVKLSSDIDPRVVVGEHAWWFPEKDPADLYGWQESNINLLTSNEPPYEPSLGTVNLRGVVCRIYKE